MASVYYGRLGGAEGACRRLEALRMAKAWMKRKWYSKGRRLDSYEVNAELADKAAQKAGINLDATSLAFHEVVAFIYHYQNLHLIVEPTAGFGRKDLDMFSRTFDQYCKGSEGGAKAKQLWSILRGLGFVYTTMEEQHYIIDMVKSADVDKSGTISLDELLNLLRRIIEDLKIPSRSREHKLIVKSGMLLHECDEWVDIFAACANTSGGSISILDMESIFSAVLGMTFGKEGTLQMKEWLVQVDEDSNEKIDFGEFICLVQKMWAADFCGIKAKTSEAIRRAEQQRATAECQLEVEEGEADRADSPKPWRQAQTANWALHVSDLVEANLDPTSSESRQLIQKMEEVLKS